LIRTRPYHPLKMGSMIMIGTGGVVGSVKMVRFYGSKAVAEGEKKPESIFDFKVVDIDGNNVSLSNYKGKVCLVVNIASKCGYTDVNYKEMAELYEKYKDKGFEILGFPCNQFGKQEPGDSCQIKDFAKGKKANFPIFEKVDVNGQNANPLYVFLKSNQKGMLGSDIKWNFTKFLCDKNGVPVKRYAPSTPPSSIEQDITSLL